MIRPPGRGDGQGGAGDRPGGAGRRGRRAGFTLVELLVVMTIMAVLAAIAAPSFRRAVDQARADLAVSNLRAIWAAQRFFWVNNRRYAGSMTELSDAGLLDPSLLADPSHDPAWYLYSTDDTGAAAAQLLRTAYGGDAFRIDSGGNVTGSVHSTDGTVIQPPARQ